MGWRAASNCATELLDGLQLDEFTSVPARYREQAETSQFPAHYLQGYSTTLLRLVLSAISVKKVWGINFLGEANFIVNITKKTFK